MRRSPPDPETTIRARLRRAQPECCGIHRRVTRRRGGVRCRAPRSGPIACASVALARDHIGLVEEPQPLVAMEHLLGRLEISAVSHDLAQALILDLRHVNGGVPRGEKGRGADRIADFLGECVHLVAEYRAGVGVGVEVEVAPVCSERSAGGLQERMAIGLERALSRSDALDDLEDRKSTRLNSSHLVISYAVFCLK